jgi:hypothetical protein
VSGLPPQPRRSIADTVTSGASAKINESKVLWSAMDPGTVTSPGPQHPDGDARRGTEEAVEG